MLTPNPGFILYIHGFNSSSQSYKARQLKGFLDSHGCENAYAIPDLDFQPDKAIAGLQEIIEQRRNKQRIGLIGSSLGGYYATWLAQQYDLRAVLVNPAVYSYRLLRQHVGPQANYHSGERYQLTLEHVDQLRPLEVEKLRQPDDFLVLLQTGDETLDYRDAAEKYQACHLQIEQGGSHGFDDFQQKIPEILRFLRFTSETE